MAGKKPNRFHFSHSQRQGQSNTVCSVQTTTDGEHWQLLSTTPTAEPEKTPTSFLAVLESWGNTWLWDNMSVSGGTEWIQHWIANGSLVAVTDGRIIPQSVLRGIRHRVLKRARTNSRVIFGTPRRGKRIPRVAIRTHGDSSRTTKREQDSPRVERRGGDHLGLLGGFE